VAWAGGVQDDPIEERGFRNLELLVLVRSLCKLIPLLFTCCLVPEVRAAVPCRYGCGWNAEGMMMMMVRVRVKAMGSQKYENVGESQSLLIMNDPIISTRTRNEVEEGGRGGGGTCGAAMVPAPVGTRSRGQASCRAHHVLVS
jgi:hypothetical protein